ncbi:MAG: hypothetical protein E2O39_05590 [Planctomycetota bacterium]|nr:MAG: hypothetical protein E2O39_05590 [Planctomycetota bacterium]
MTRASRRVAAAALLLLSVPVLAAAPRETPTTTEVTSDDGRGTDYILNRSDNICGLDNPRQLTRPAKIDYDVLLAETSEMKLMKKEKINASSPRGIQLRTAAAKKVSRACEKVRSDKSYCSVWKSIRRRDGKRIKDITTLVKKEISGK